MSSFNNIIQQSLIIGKKVEERFCNDLLRCCSGEVMHSDATTDAISHIDVFWRDKKDDKWVSFDVKGLRKKNRSDNDVSVDTTWLELQNVNGHKGSLYGDANYLVFEGVDSWYIVRRQTLLNNLLNTIKDNTVYFKNPNEDFKYYQRKGRKDIIVRVPFSFIIKNTAKTIKKS